MTHVSQRYDVNVSREHWRRARDRALATQHATGVPIPVDGRPRRNNSVILRSVFRKKMTLFFFNYSALTAG